jgi:hypothetical protein
MEAVDLALDWDFYAEIATELKTAILVSKMNNPGKLATFGTQDEDKQKSHNMCWTPLYSHKHK